MKFVRGWYTFLLFAMLCPMTEEAISRKNVKKIAEKLMVRFQAARAASCKKIKKMAESSVGKIAATVAIALSLYRWFTPDPSLPTLEELDLRTFLPIDAVPGVSTITDEKEIQKSIRAGAGVIKVGGRCYQICRGVPDALNGVKEPVFIYSSGVCNSGPSANCVYLALRASTMTGPVVVAEYPTHARRRFNFCEKPDQECLRLVHEEILYKASEGVNIVFFGVCKGAANALRYVANNQDDHIKAVIAESPITSWEKALSSWRVFGPVQHAFCRFACPHYHPKPEQPLVSEANFPPKCKILIGSTPGDNFSQLGHVEQLVRDLAGQGAWVEHFVCDGPDARIPHGRIGKAPSWQDRAGRFYREHGLRT